MSFILGALMMSAKRDAPLVPPIESPPSAATDKIKQKSDKAFLVESNLTIH